MELAQTLEKGLKPFYPGGHACIELFASAHAHLRLFGNCIIAANKYET